MFRKEYYFCFMMNSLQLLNNIEMQLETSTHFKLQIYHYRMVATTPQFLSVLNQHSEVLFNGQIMKFKFYQQNESSKQVCQIRLLQISQQFGQRIIGGYQFLLRNYIKAFQDFNRNRIELNVQIGQNYIINYDVFIQNSQEAMIRITKEHQTAKKFNIHHDAISEIQSFLPHQITNQNLEDIYKEIKIDQESPLLLSQRFWSPKRKNSKHFKKNSIISQTTQKIQQVTAHSLFENRISFLKLNKLASSSSQFHHNTFNQNSKELASLQIQSQNESQKHNKDWFKLYQVIQSQSKIVYHQNLQNQKKELPLLTRQNKQKKSIEIYNTSIKYLILVVIVITALAFFVFLFDKPTLSFHKKRKPKPKRRSL